MYLIAALSDNCDRIQRNAIHRSTLILIVLVKGGQWWRGKREEESESEWQREREKYD